ncbi:MAG: hypothetical protein A2901_03555 [Elusimicrobia bacterium RIFCSPLOWO2_01_FULL_54_10]|nr:MAG: hypothetical protein A2901_03555 [Elusimicrobia bacterium RIFCSPLOWO2_01_FULL_54_10]
MKHKGFPAAFCILLASVCLQASERAVLLPGSAIWLEGDSTLHRFSSTSTALTAEMEGTFPDVKTFVVRVPVLSLKSGKGQLDKNLYKALHSEKYPDIVFHMKSYDIKSSTNGTVILAQGDLEIAGASRPAALQAQTKPDELGTRVSGAYGLLMTDFGVSPPVMMLGALKTKNEVTVRYILYLDFNIHHNTRKTNE